MKKIFSCIFIFSVFFMLFADKNSLADSFFSFEKQNSTVSSLYNVLNVQSLDTFTVIAAQKEAEKLSYIEKANLWNSLKRKTSSTGLKYSFLNLLGFGIGSFLQDDTKTGYFLLGLDLTCIAVYAFSDKMQKDAYSNANVSLAEYWQKISTTLLTIQGIGRTYAFIHPFFVNSKNKAYNEKLQIALNFYSDSIGVSASVYF